MTDSARTRYPTTTRDRPDPSSLRRSPWPAPGEPAHQRIDAAVEVGGQRIVVLGEQPDEIWIELRSRGVLQGCDCLGNGPRPAVRSVQPVGIARAIPLLMVRPHDRRDQGPEAERCDDPRADLGMAPDLDPFERCQGSPARSDRPARR